MSTYRCTKCGWTGDEPRQTHDHRAESVFESGPDGGGFVTKLIAVRIPICPSCYATVRSIDAREAA